MGDDVFYALLRAWVDRHRFGVVTTADFLALVRDEAGIDPDRLLGPWLCSRRCRPWSAPRRPAPPDLAPRGQPSPSSSRRSSPTFEVRDDAEHHDHPRADPPSAVHLQGRRLPGGVVGRGHGREATRR